jgi:hypothetical protein
VGKVGSTPIFRYYNPAGTQLTTPLNTSGASPIPTNSVARVSMLEISFQTLPTNGNQDPLRRADRDSRVYVRVPTADSTDSDPNRLVCG